jgi:hypothetical protein
MPSAFGGYPLGRHALARDALSSRKSGNLATVQIIDYYAITAAASSTIVAPKDCVALIYAYAPGASGGGSTSLASSGGGGGSAGYARIPLSVGQSLSYAVGSAGAAPMVEGDGTDAGDVVVTRPDGVAMTAGGGKKGRRGNNAAGGAGGIATGFDVNKTGGAGGTAGPSSGSGGGTGGTGEGGATGGAGSTGNGGGGGGAGFLDVTDLDGPPSGGGGPGNAAVAPTAPGGGSGAGSGKDGAAPALYVYLVRFI